MPSVTNVLLNLTLLPSRRRVAELWSKHIVIGHGQKAHVDLPFFATPDTVNRSAHIVVDPALWNAAEYTKAMPMGIKQHLVGLQQISADHKSPTVRQLDMGDL